MATEKIINTRIQLKYDTLTNWNTNSSLILRKGEVGICAIPTGSSHLQTTPPAIMFKVGDGVTTFENLPWASALAADVYAWAKKSVPNVADFGDIIAAAREGLISADSVVKTLNSLKGDVTIEAATGETHIVVAKDGQKITFALKLSNAEKAALTSGITAEKVEAYDGYDERITAAKTAADTAQTTANGKYTLPIAGIPKADLSDEVTSALTKADSALQSHQTITTGSGNGTIAVGGKDVAVKGLAALAYKASLGKADVGLGNVENKTLDTTVTKDSANYITSGAVKTAIDSAIAGVTQFDIVKYDSFDKLPTTGVKGVIYIVAHTHSDSNDSYDEYIWNTALETPAYEKIGNTDVNLTNYVNGISGTANNGVVTNISKNGNTITVTSKSLETEDPTVEAGNTIAFINSVSQAADGKITAHKQNVPSATKTQLGLVKAGATSGKIYGVDVAADGAMTVNVPWENTQNDNTWRNITLDGTAYKGTGTDTGALDLRHGKNIDLSIDDTTKGVVIAAKNQTVKVGTATFGADDAVEIKAGTNVSVSADTAAKTITISGKTDADINSLIDTKIGGLDGAITGTAGAGKTLTALTQINGKVSATFGNIAITASQVSDFDDKVNAKINAHAGVDKVGTVTSVSAGVGLKISGTASVAPKVEIDDDVVFVFNCGSATELVD